MEGGERAALKSSETKKKKNIVFQDDEREQEMLSMEW